MTGQPESAGKKEEAPAVSLASASKVPSPYAEIQAAARPWPPRARSKGRKPLGSNPYSGDPELIPHFFLVSTRGNRVISRQRDAKLHEVGPYSPLLAL